VFFKIGEDKRMQGLAQTNKEQVTIQVGQDLIDLVSHQLLNSAASLQILYDLWSKSDALSAPQKAETLQVLQQEVNFLHRLGRYVLQQRDLPNSSELLLNLKPVDMVDLIKQMLPSFQLQGPNREFEINDWVYIWRAAWSGNRADECGWKVRPLKPPPFISPCFWPVKSSRFRLSMAILIY
jgi:hypothetical protein